MNHERRDPTPPYARRAASAMLLALGASCSAGVQEGGASTPAGTPDAAGTAADASSGAGSSDGAASEPLDAPNEGAPSGDAATPPSVSSTPPFDWVGIVGTGQSLGVGGGFNSQAISTMQPFSNLKLVDNGPDPKYPIEPDSGAPQWAVVPLVELIRDAVAGTDAGYTDGQYPNNIQGETPHSGMANALSFLWGERGDAATGDYVTAHSVVGWAGHCLVDIDKEGGQRAYPASINEARVWTQLAAEAGKTFGYGGVVLTHGECDATTADYGQGVYQLWQDYNGDLKAITGQKRDIVLFASQQSTIDSGASGSAVQLWQASQAHPGEVVCTGPKYQYEYGPDYLHLPSAGYVRLGEKYAEVFDLVVNQNIVWKPLQPNKVTRAQAVVTVDFDVPNPPLVWDPNMAKPHQSVNTAWAAGNGFEVTDSSGNPLTITAAEIQGSSVILTLAADPGSDQVTVGYALTQDGSNSQGGLVSGLRGLLRDSDEFVGYDAEVLVTQVTQGSAVVTSTSSGEFVHRAGWDLVSGAALPTNAIVVSHDSDDQLTLSVPWAGASGMETFSYHHDERNFCVHFSMMEE
jgi:hypothetical protein